MNAAAWASASNLLCVRLDNIGDVLMTTPAIRALRESVPGRRITLLASRSGAQAAAHIPEIDDVLVYDAPWMKSTVTRSNLPDFAMVRTLGRRGFDGAVIFTVYTQSALPAALQCWMAGIPLRLAHCRENPYQLLSDWAAETEPHSGVRHEVRRQLDLVANIGCRTTDTRLSFRVTQAAHERAAARLRASGVDPRRPWLVVHPGASAPSRRYPPAQFAAAARTLATRYGWQIVFTGANAERELVNQISAAMAVRTYSLAGQLSLEELGALIAHTRVLLTNNSGPAHLAAAVGTPVVDLYALTNPQHTPWQVPSRVLYHDVPCRFCYKSICPKQHHYCLTMIDPARVVEAVQDLAGAAGYASTASHPSAPSLSQPLRAPASGSETSPPYVHTRN
jgi:lipopolysaccharide heptosyltransferase II